MSAGYGDAAKQQLQQDVPEQRGEGQAGREAEAREAREEQEEAEQQKEEQERREVDRGQPDNGFGLRAALRPVVKGANLALWRAVQQQ